jgi:hypothetical protein
LGGEVYIQSDFGVEKILPNKQWNTTFWTTKGNKNNERLPCINLTISYTFFHFYSFNEMRINSSIYGELKTSKKIDYNRT